MKFHHLRTAIVVLALAGCGEPDIDNPTGDCEPDDDGARVCYHSPDSSDQYLPDCDPPLNQELWRVFAQDTGTAYMIPRPDTMGIETGICDGDDADLDALFRDNGLCEEVADPDVVNSMTPADALAISHELHQRLEFEAVSYGDDTWGISPWAPDSDLLDACDGPLADDAAVADMCGDLADSMGSGQCLEMAVIYDEAEATAFAAGLNLVYGVSIEE